ncbi:reprolysin-like metallopeptidase [Aliiglaciecola sp. LCG003]|uniref:reprolysin-like metallopeptidase n=1 Tax=Aliiglaciecola sp. LCG003 TaxID=3053655 RepID=UPI002573049E|nr:zinc-dependent metalloprotease family protein [Aliiglaciecola sp. LCG003]WJG09988.1 M12 family metallo-peptidase [Aliiglaciecola sp. LCG003]
MNLITRLWAPALVALMTLHSAYAISANQEDLPLWITQAAKSEDGNQVSRSVTQGYQLKINPVALQAIQKDTTAQFELAIPMPDGEQKLYRLSQVKVMAAALADKYPDIRSFIGVDVANPKNRGRFNLSPRGLSGMFTYQNEWAFLTYDKIANTQQYISYFGKHEVIPEQIKINQQDYMRIPESAIANTQFKPASQRAARANGNSVTTYRLAISASGEYTQANGGEAQAMAELVTLVNRINQIFLTDLAIQFELVANNDRIIFTDAATDPFENDSSVDLDKNQQTIDSLIGSANYDIGHLVNTDSGGLATIQSICIDGYKARGQTGSSRPFGESFYIQLAIHEFGHQLAAEHTFNAVNSSSCTSDQRSRNSAVEPGSGSTIMSYAGICGSQNIQNDADGYFHSASIEEIRTNLARRSCGNTLSNGNSIPVIASQPIEHTIPANTPFVLSAEVTDPDNDLLSYSWDQIDPGGFEGATESVGEMAVDNGANPLFRSYSPRSSSSRYFPRLIDVLNDSISFGETYPQTQRQLNFELIARDGRGGVNTLQASLSVEPTTTDFAVSAPLAQARWLGGENQTVRWNVATTDVPPISCPAVDILLDTDGNRTFESTLLSGTPNDGQQQVSAPSTSTEVARLMIKCSDNVFYAVNPGSFTIMPSDNAVAPLITGQTDFTVVEDSTFTIGFADLTVDDPDSDYPSNFTLTLIPGANYTIENNIIRPEQDFNGALSINVIVNDSVSDSNIYAFIAQVSAVNDAPIAVNETASVEQNSGPQTFTVVSNDFDPDGDNIKIVEIRYGGQGSASFNPNDGSITYTPDRGFFGTEVIHYDIEDPDLLTDSASLTITVQQPTVTPVPLPDPEPNSGGGGSVGWLLALLGMLRLSCTGHSIPLGKSE